MKIVLRLGEQFTAELGNEEGDPLEEAVKAKLPIRLN